MWLVIHDTLIIPQKKTAVLLFGKIAAFFLGDFFYSPLFKVAVELGAITHMLAAVHDIDDDTMIKLRAMCTDEVKRINGIINFEKAVRYQRG